MPLIIPSNSQSATGYTIDQSIRFNDDDSAYLSKTWSGAGDKQKFTFSFWVKRGNITSRQILLSFRQDVPLEFEADDTLRVYLFGTTALNTNRLFRDPAAWYHIVLSVDSTQAVSSERVRLYVNGQRETSFSAASYPSLNASANIYTSTLENYIGRIVNGSNYFDGYMAEIHFLDGISYGPEFFGETTSNGLWIPKEYNGSYGTNGYKIDGRDSSDLGDDESGNGNDFTANGLAAHDQVLDSPTNNFCVMNSIENVPCTFTQGNLTIDSTSNFTGAAIRGTVHIQGGSTGKWYYEVVGSLTGDYFSTGWMLSSIITPGSTVIGQDVGSVAFYNTGSYQNTTNVQGVISKPAAGDVIGVGLDASTGQVFLRDDSGWYVGTLSSNALSSGVVITGFSGEDLVMASRNSSSGTATYNFGQDGTFAGAKTAQGNTDANGIGNFFYTVPDGFLAICTKNLGS